MVGTVGRLEVGSGNIKERIICSNIEYSNDSIIYEIITAFFLIAAV